MASSQRLDNADEILAETDRLLGESRSPDLEYIFVTPFITWHIPFTNKKYGICFNIYGHTAVRYRLPYDTTVNGLPEDAESVVMNIHGKEGRGSKGKIAHFHTPEDYLFSDEASQGGIFSRKIISVRFYNVPEEKRWKLHEYYTGINKRQGKFDLFLFPLFNTLGHIFPLVERGNCARWTMKGFHEAGIIRSYSMWPKVGLIRLFEENPDSKVVVYEQHPDAEKGYNKTGTPISNTLPMGWFQEWCYSDMNRYASVVVDVDPEKNIGVPRLNPNPAPRNRFRNLINKPTFYVPMSLGTGYLTWKVGTVAIKTLKFIR